VTPDERTVIEDPTASKAGGGTPENARLSERTLMHVPQEVLRPQYDRARTRIGTVHFGPGAFHRAHQAFYFDRLLERDADRAVSAISLRTPTVRDALAPQDGLYTLMEIEAAPSARVIGAIRELLVAAEDPVAVSRRLAAPGTSLVTTTVTEKGYCLDGAGELDLNHPDIAHDLNHPDTPRSLAGWIVRGLALRREQALTPFLVMPCDNLPDNGQRLKRAVLALAACRDRTLAGWIEERTCFAGTMVDSITPATDEPLRSRVAQVLGMQDSLPVQRERFVQWVVEETGFAGQPDWASAGVTLSRDVSAYERAKLRLLNGAHSTLAYLGLLAQLETVAQSMAQPAVRTFVERLMVEDIQPTLAAPRGAELDAYRQSILRRFENPSLRHQLSQIAWDGSQKLPIRILGTISDAIAARRPVSRLVVPVAAWMHFIRMQAAAARAIVDPLASELADCGRNATGAARQDLPAFFRLPGMFPARLVSDAGFVKALGDAYDLITRHGPLAAAAVRDGRREP
jgi:fructuronate reductase